MDLTPAEAAATLARAAGYEDPLRQRTEGLILMVWGLVTSAMFVTYGLAGVLGAREWVFATLWLPWVAVGVVMSGTIWRTACLSRPERMLQAPSRPLLRVLGLSAAIGVVYAVAQPDGPTLPLGITGAAWVALGAANLFRDSQRGRLLWVASGAVLLAAAAALAAADAPVAVAGTAGIALPAVAAVGAGAWQALRA